jgi:hypothetical protein
MLAHYTGYYNELRTHLSLGRIRRAIGRSNASAGWPLSRSSADSIINTAGSSFWQAQVSNESAPHLRTHFGQPA